MKRLVFENRTVSNFHLHPPATMAEHNAITKQKQLGDTLFASFARLASWRVPWLAIDCLQAPEQTWAPLITSGHSAPSRPGAQRAQATA